MTSPISILIPVRVDSQERLLNLLYIVRSLSLLPFVGEIIVLEADIEMKLLLKPKSEIFTHIFVQDEDPIFHRTKYINQLLLLGRNNICGIWDTDVIVPSTQIRMAVHAIEKGGHTLVYPYSEGIVFLDVETSQHITLENLTEEELSHYLRTKESSMVKLCRPSYGGAFFVDKYKYLILGGENQNFYGWGPEDVERAKRIQILGGGVKRIQGDAFHLEHPRGINSTEGTGHRAVLLSRELVKICTMSKQELNKYVDTWDWNHSFIDLDNNKNISV